MNNFRSIIIGIILIFLLGLNGYAQQNKMIVNADLGTNTISKHIYGHFAEHLGYGIYGGIWVGEDSEIPNVDGYRKDVLNALQDLNIPNLRWPGGCFADDYHWKDGIGPRSERPERVNVFWDQVTESNAFGTHEFLRLCELLDTEPYIAGNVGSGTVQEMSQWVEYLTYDGDSEMANWRRENGRKEPWDIQYFGVGNENWGCGGNMTAEFYADQYKRYATYCHDYGDNELYKIASGASGDDYHWTEVLMKEVGHQMDGISLHYYTIPGPGWNNKSSSTEFTEKQYFNGLQAALRLDEIISKHSGIMDQYDPGKDIGLMVDEWGVWLDPLEGTNPGFLRQQNSLRDALIASVSLDILNAHADRVKMANIAQTVNVLQAMILTEGEQMTLTPTYHVFDMYQVHKDATYLPFDLQQNKYEYNGENIPGLSTTVSRNDAGRIHVTMSNLDPDNAKEVTLEIRGEPLEDFISGRVLTADEIDAYNTFDNPDNVKPENFDDIDLNGNQVTINIPAKSIIVFGIQ